MTDNDFREPTGMYNIPAITAQISKNAQEARRKNLNKHGQMSQDREVSDERCKEMRRKSVEKMKNGWGETDVMKKKKKEEEQKKK